VAVKTAGVRWSTATTATHQVAVSDSPITWSDSVMSSESTSCESPSTVREPLAIPKSCAVRPFVVVVRVRVEIMGPGKCGIVGKSQPGLVMINPIIFTRTRTSRRPRLISENHRQALSGWGARMHAYTSIRMHQAASAGGRGGGGAVSSSR
jgi:hypothetical protein